MEGYHVPQTHPQLTLGHPEQYDPDSLAYTVHGNGHSSFQLRPNAQAKKGRQVGVSEIDAIIESTHLLSSGLESMTLDRDVHVIEGMRHRPIPEGSTFGAELVKPPSTSTPPAPASRCPHRTRPPWPDGAASSSCSPTTSCSPNTATPWSTGRVPTGTIPNRACSSCGRSPSPPRVTTSPHRPRGALRAGRHRALAAHPTAGLLQHRAPATRHPQCQRRRPSPVAHLRGGHHQHAPRARPLPRVLARWPTPARTARPSPASGRRHRRRLGGGGTDGGHHRP